ncbi:MAG: phosphotransferase [Candidatus Promineifilaceae bacterium]|nr:phosphotransferase [Candidatus Promineifilaceae bacterium]
MNKDGSVLDRSHLEAYLQTISGKAVHIEAINQLGGDQGGAAALKAFGYGQPLHIRYQVDDQRREVVLRRVRRNGFGREMAADRVAAVWLDYETFNHLPGHVSALDMIGLAQDQELYSLGHIDDLLLLTDYVLGEPYAEDLARIRDTGTASAQDMARAGALADYLVRIHARKHDEPLLWRRRLRDLIGHGEGIMGLADSYPPDFALASADDLLELEQAANRWRWQLKPLTHRLSQVHGDFHPFNILFRQGLEFHLVDRSRGPWGEPADDVSCLSINYLFFSLQRDDRLAEPFASLYRAFWENYLDGNPDHELLTVIQPWFAWRALVLASPQWYANIAEEVRRKLLHFARQVLATPRFEWSDVNRYLTG